MLKDMKIASNLVVKVYDTWISPHMILSNTLCA